VKVALTGATGFVGGHLARALVARGDAVTAIVRSPAKADGLRALGCRLVEGELTDASARQALLAGAEVLYHVAGRIGAPSLDAFRAVNRDLAALVARDAASAGVSRVLLVSTLAVTGPAPRGRSLDERSGPGPVTDYGRSKQEGEEAVKAAGVPLTIVRPPAVYGPGDRAFLTLFKLGAGRGIFPLLGDGRQELSLVFAEDLARALIAAATSPATLGGTYHAAHDEVIVQRDLGETLGRALGRPLRLVRLPGPLVRGLLHAGKLAAGVTGRSFLPAPDKAHELLAPAWRASSEALRRDASWTAEVPVERGFALTASAYRSAGWI
jgi:nucleoside-diphosphate-sugar epimerase